MQVFSQNTASNDQSTSKLQQIPPHARSHFATPM